MNQVIYKKLKKIAREKSVIYYSKLGQMINLDMNNPADRNRIAKILDEINRHEVKQYGRPMLSAVVIKKSTGMPGEGFFKCAKDLDKYRGGTDYDFWAHELDEVHNYWQSH